VLDFALIYFFIQLILYRSPSGCRARSATSRASPAGRSASSACCRGFAPSNSRRRSARNSPNRTSFRTVDPAPVVGVHHDEALRNWIRQDEAKRGVRIDRPATAETEELRGLRKENAEPDWTPASALTTYVRRVGDTPRSCLSSCSGSWAPTWSPRSPLAGRPGSELPVWAWRSGHSLAHDLPAGLLGPGPAAHSGGEQVAGVHHGEEEHPRGIRLPSVRLLATAARAGARHIRRPGTARMNAAPAAAQHPARRILSSPARA
jgi:hypothetical protein